MKTDNFFEQTAKFFKEHADVMEMACKIWEDQYKSEHKRFSDFTEYADKEISARDAEIAELKKQVESLQEDLSKSFDP